MSGALWLPGPFERDGVAHDAELFDGAAFGFDWVEPVFLLPAADIAATPRDVRREVKRRQRGILPMVAALLISSELGGRKSRQVGLYSCPGRVPATLV